MRGRSWYSLIHPEDLSLSADSHRSLGNFAVNCMERMNTHNWRLSALNHLILCIKINPNVSSSASRRRLPSRDGAKTPVQGSVLDLDLHSSQKVLRLSGDKLHKFHHQVGWTCFPDDSIRKVSVGMPPYHILFLQWNGSQISADKNQQRRLQTVIKLRQLCSATVTSQQRQQKL